MYFFACNQEKINTCAASIEYIPTYLGFVNYNEADIETIIRQSFEKGSNFNTLVATDTIVMNASPITRGDNILYNDSDRIPFPYIYDYKIIIPGAGKTHIINDITIGDKVRYTEVKGECLRGHVQAVITKPLSFNLDNVVYDKYWQESVNYYVMFCIK